MKTLFKIFLLIIIAIGVLYTNPNLFPPLHNWLKRVVNLSRPAEEGAAPELTVTPSASKQSTTTLTPARDLSGRWVGSKLQGATYRQSSICEYTADVVINLTQKNNAVNGTISFTTKSVEDLDAEDFTPCPPTGYLTGDFLVKGTLSGTNINFDTETMRGNPALPIKFKGVFTSDIMSGTFERLPYSSSQLAELSRVSGTWIVTKTR